MVDETKTSLRLLPQQNIFGNRLSRDEHEVLMDHADSGLDRIPRR